MTKNEMYYLVLVCGSFLVFAVSMAAAYLKYRNWVRQHPGAAD